MEGLKMLRRVKFLHRDQKQSKKSILPLSFILL
jgi:hypothetical protein